MQRRTTIFKIGEIIVREYKLSDEIFIAEQFSHPTILKNIRGIAGRYTKKDAKNFLKKYMQKQDPRESGFHIEYAIEISGQFAGGIGVTIQGHKAKIGYWLGKSWWGKGYMTKVVEAFSVHLNRKYKIKRISAIVFSFNKASQSVLKKCRFQYEGKLRKNHKIEDKYFDDLLFSKIMNVT